ncbi:Hypothetical predicted protein [Cloeon dipterum]|uniref:Peptidase S54 rhomboid domain-containing protein n=1 Tax=Cloeon dipterum TaxID=197152 RepID=A0A8S1CXZ0_9INSE|nr:Hypothetical predicted protein [Cloeon dipterum]
MQRQRRNRGLEYGVILLLIELFNIGINNVPPVTLISIIGQLALYSGFLNVPWDKWDVCLNARDIIRNKEYRRLFLSAVEHGDDMHLYYNMLSFLVKGRSLERRMGSKNFLLTLAVLTVLTSCYYVGLGWALTHFTNDVYYTKVCAVGFSGVIFALKVLTSEQQDTSMRYAVWSELILIYLMVPGSSFMGHLAGILAGLTFSRTRIGKFLKKIIEGVTGGRYDDNNYYQSQQQQQNHEFNAQANFFNNPFGGFGYRRPPPAYGYRNPQNAPYGWNF